MADKRQFGFTVVELLITVGIFLIVLAAIGAMLVSGTRGYETTARVSEALQDSEAVLQLLRYDVGLAGYRGLSEAEYNRPFTLDGSGQQATVEIASNATGHEVTVRYFEDRYVGPSDTGERRVTYFVDPDDQSLHRTEKNPIDGELESTLMVGNIMSMEALKVVDHMRVETAVDVLPTGLVSGVVAGLTLRVQFVDGKSWDLLIGFTSPQSVEVL